MNTIVVIDDSPEDYEALYRAFKKIGNQSPIVHEDDPSSAMDTIRQHQPKLILLDLNMPEMDGQELLRLIKQDLSTHNIPVIIFSTSNNERDINECYELGANAYLQKPLNFDHYLKLAKNIDEFWINANIVGKQP